MEELRGSCRPGQFDFEFDYVLETLLQEIVGGHKKVTTFRDKIQLDEIQDLIESEPEEMRLKLRLISPGYRSPKTVRIKVPDLETIFGDDKAYLKKMTVYGYTIRRHIRAAVSEVADLLNHHPEIQIRGKKAHQQRDVGFFSNVSEGYSYSGQVAKSTPLTASLGQILDWVNYLFKSKYNGVLVNRYVTGKDYISPHSDNENGLSPLAGVVSISYGQTRTFTVRERYANEVLFSTPLESYDLVQMGGSFQQVYAHEVPKDKTTGTRYSFTFRQHS